MTTTATYDQRNDRLASLLQQAIEALGPQLVENPQLAEVLNRNEIRDPDLDGVSVTVTQVKPSPDMRHATVFCEPLGGQNAKEIVAALNRHKGFLRGEMGHRITMKFTPELRFVEDESFAEAQKIEDILRSERVARDLAASRDGEEED